MSNPSGVFVYWNDVKIDGLPQRGDLIVKRWKNGAVWAGVYSGSEKDSSFDSWCILERESEKRKA